MDFIGCSHSVVVNVIKLQNSPMILFFGCRHTELGTTFTPRLRSVPINAVRHVQVLSLTCPSPRAKIPPVPNGGCSEFIHFFFHPLTSNAKTMFLGIIVVERICRIFRGKGHGLYSCILFHFIHITMNLNLRLTMVLMGTSCHLSCLLNQISLDPYF